MVDGLMLLVMVKLRGFGEGRGGVRGKRCAMGEVVVIGRGVKIRWGMSTADGVGGVEGL